MFFGSVGFVVDVVLGFVGVVVWVLVVVVVVGVWRGERVRWVGVVVVVCLFVVRGGYLFDLGINVRLFCVFS